MGVVLKAFEVRTLRTNEKRVSGHYFDCSLQVSADVTDSSDQTIPWATPSVARDRTLPSLSSSISSQGSIPECIQNERGQLMVTHRGRFQVRVMSLLRHQSASLSF